MKCNIEVTDTFGGESNYSWVRRYTVEMPDESSNLAIMRRAKREAGYSGIRGATNNFGDMIEFRPSGICHVMFITFEV